MDDKISAVVGKLQQRLGDYYEVRIVDVTKNNDTVKKGISVRKNGEKIGRIYYWNGEALEAFQSVHNVTVILCYTVLYNFLALVFALIRVRKHWWDDITQGKQ